MTNEMRQLPDPATYDREISFMPYRDSLEFVQEYVIAHAPRGGPLVDLMCGPGFLVSRLASRRSDLTIIGVDNDPRFIRYAMDRLRGAWDIGFAESDVLTWEPSKRFDVVLCTGALHHLPYERQEDLIEKMSKMTNPDGFAIISDCHIDDYINETERKLAAAKLGHEYLAETIKNGADNEVVSVAVDVLSNDVLMHEFKTSVEKRREICERHFSLKEVHKTWPSDGKLTGYGDYIFILEPRRR